MDFYRDNPQKCVEEKDFLKRFLFDLQTYKGNSLKLHVLILEGHTFYLP